MATNPADTSGKARDPTTLFNAYVEFMKLMFGNLFLLNAGSATALMTFLGTRTTDNLRPYFVSPEGARWAVTLFAIGATSAVAATAFAGMTESLNAGNLERRQKLSIGLGITSAAFVLLSGVCFLFACILGVNIDN